MRIRMRWLGKAVKGAGDAIGDAAEGIGKGASAVLKGAGQAGDRLLDTVDHAVDGTFGLANNIVDEGGRLVRGGQKLAGGIVGDALETVDGAVDVVGENPALLAMGLGAATGGTGALSALLGGLGGSRSGSAVPATTSTGEDWLLPVGLGVGALAVVALLMGDKKKGARA